MKNPNTKFSNHLITKTPISHYLEGFMRARTFLSSKFFTAICIGIFFVGTAFITGCKKSDSNPVAADQTVTTTDDAADAVSDALASNNGGAMDQVNDVFELAGGVGVGAESLSKTAADSTFWTRTFDSTTTKWTTHLYKQKSGLLYYGIWTREFQHQFIANGKAQKFRAPIVGSVADSIIHQILAEGCSGYFWTPRLTHHLTSLSASWVASNTNTDTVTINGTYARSGVDTITVAARKGRVFVSSLTLTFKNVKGPRGSRLSRSEKTSGEIDGTYTATVTVTGKAPFTITKTFIIILGGGTATYTIDTTKYVRDLATGDPI